MLYTDFVKFYLHLFNALMIILITTLNEIIDNNIKVPHTDRRFIINKPNNIPNYSTSLY